MRSVKPLRILHLEDDAALRRSFVRALPSFEWLGAATLEQALDLLSREPDRLLIDVQLDGEENIDGLAFLEQVRALGLRTPGIILSGHLDFNRTLFAIEHGAVAVSKAGLVPEGLRDLLESPLAGGAESPRLSLQQLAAQVRGLAGPLASNLRELRQLAIEGALAESDGNQSATARKTGYTRTHVARFTPGKR